MRTSFRVRAAAVAAAVALPFAGLLAAAPAHAAESATIEVDQTTFVEGDWGTGFHITGTGFVGTGDVTVTVGASFGPSKGDVLYATLVTPDAEGGIDAQILPDAPAVSPAPDGYPKYGVSASQDDGAGSAIWSNGVELTITSNGLPDPSVSFTQVVSPEQLAAGLTANLANFTPSSKVSYYYFLVRDNEMVGEGVSGSIDVDGSGAGSYTITIAGAQVGDTLQVFNDDAAGLFGDAEVPVVAAPPAPAPADTTPKPALAETGVELTAGLVGAGVLALGVLALLARRRFATR